MQSTQNLKFLSFLGAEKTGETHGDWTHSIKPSRSILSISAFATARYLGPSLYGSEKIDLVPGWISM